MKSFKLVIGFIGSLLCLAVSGAFGAAVDASSPDGIAAIHTSEFAASGVSTGVSILGTDGHIYVSNNALQAPGKWECISVEWPVPFGEITEWMPGNGGFGPGYIVTTSGERWCCEATTDKRGYKDPEWSRLSLDGIIASIKEKERCE